VDVQVKQMMQRLPSKVADGEKPPQGNKPRKTPWRNEPPQLRDDLYRAFGVDLTQVPGINTLTAQMLLTEIGPDLFRFPTAAAFCSWLRLCPDPKISGGQVLSSRTRPTKNRAALALRMATQGLHRSDTFLGDYFRRMKARMGAPKAMTATAHKLARIVYHMITTQQEYDTTVFQEQEQRRRNRRTAKLHAQARELGFHLVPLNSVFRFTSRSYTANYQPRPTMLRQRTAKCRLTGCLSRGVQSTRSAPACRASSLCKHTVHGAIASEDTDCG
jgi:hypothetical protein